MIFLFDLNCRGYHIYRHRRCHHCCCRRHPSSNFQGVPVISSVYGLADLDVTQLDNLINLNCSKGQGQ